MQVSILHLLAAQLELMIHVFYCYIVCVYTGKAISFSKMGLSASKELNKFKESLL